MARNGSGTYNRAVAPYTAGTTITASTVNSEMDDIATALTGSMARDGQSPPTANIPMGGFRLTGLGNAVASTDAAPLGQVVAKAGDTLTGALGVVAGTAAAPGVFVSGDTNTGLFQPSADTLSVSVGGTEVARYGTGGFMRLADGTAAAPAYSFTGDTDTGIYTPSANRVAVTLGGVLTLDIKQTDAVLYGDAAQVFSGLYMQNLGASASNQRVMDFSALNESGIPGTSIFQRLATDGSAVLELYATPSGARNTDRRVNRMTIPGSGAISMVGPVNVDGKALQIQRGTEQATTSGTAIDFTGIPAGVRRITVMFDGVSFTGADSASIQLGDSGGIETTGYSGNAGIVAGASSGGIGTLSSAAVVIYGGTAAADNCSGVIQIVNQSGNKWLITGQTARNGTPQIFNVIASKTLSDVLDRIRFKVDGASSFDAGAINIMWEF